MDPDLFYNGTTLEWYGVGVFKASSGLPGHQRADEQLNSDEGPIPEGLYSFPLKMTRDADIESIDREGAHLDRREGVEHLPPSFEFRGKTYINQAWGPDRVRLTVQHYKNPKVKRAGGFYLHDSHKGFSHGCIEVEQRFFMQLRGYIARGGKRTRLYVKVDYPSATASTYGGTAY